MLNRAFLGSVVAAAQAACCFASAAPFDASAPSSYAPLPEAVTSFGAITHAGWLYFYGGHLGERHEYSSNEVSGACRRLNLAEGIAWESLPASVPAQSPALVAHDGFLYRVAGMAARNAKGEKRDLYSHVSVERLNPNSGQWESLPPLPEPRSSHDAVMVGDQLVVAGGWHLAGKDQKPKWHDTALALDVTKAGAAWTTISQPFKRRGLCVAAFKSKLYCIGGISDGDEPSLQVDVLDTATGQWSRGPDLPDGKLKGFGSAACVVDGRLFVNSRSGVVWRLNDRGDSWEVAGRLRTPRFFHRLLPAGSGQLLALGGESEAGKLRDVEIITLSPRRAGEWPGFRGPRRDGTTDETLVSTRWPKEGPPVLWRASLGQGLSSFAVSAGRAYTLGNANDLDTVWCLDVTNGSVLWRFDYSCASTNHPMSIVPRGPAATPTVIDGKVFTLSREGDFHCLDSAAGQLVWKTHLLRDLNGKRPVYGYANSPLVAGGLVFLDVGGTNGSTVALDAGTGAVRWHSGEGEAGYSTPRIASLSGQPVLALFKGETFTLLKADTGSLIAAHPFTTRDFCNTITPVVAGATAFISNTGTEGTLRLDFAGAAPRVVWRKPDLGLLFNSPVLWQGCLYAFNDAKRNENELLCVDAATGMTCWSFNGVGKGVFTVADGKMILLTRQGELAILKLSRNAPEILARAQLLGGKCWVEPVLADGRILCRNLDEAVVAVPASPSN